MVRVRLDLGYDGTGFAGWAVQPGRRTVQGVLEDALGTLLRCEVGADGRRPDRRRRPRHRAGVPRGRAARRLGGAARARGGAVAVRRPAGAAGGRAAARRPGARRLAGAGGLRRAVLGALAALRVPALRRPGRGAAAAAARRRRAPPAAGRRGDVRGVRARWWGCTTSRPSAGAGRARRRCGRCWSTRGTATTQGFLVGHVVADAFCHSMVRALVGAVLPVGEGRRPVTWPAEVLAAGVRDPAVAVAPAHGLTLAEVRYPPPEALASRSAEARAVRQLP